MLPINKIYINSSFKTPGSKSTSDFSIQLHEPIELPENCMCSVSDVAIPNFIKTITDTNNKIYIRIVKHETSGGAGKQDPSPPERSEAQITTSAPSSPRPAAPKQSESKAVTESVTLPSTPPKPTSSDTKPKPEPSTAPPATIKTTTLAPIRTTDRFVDKQVELEVGFYDASSLLATILSKLNKAIGGFSGTFDPNTRKISLTSSHRFYILTDAELKNMSDWNGPYYNPYALNTCNEVIGNTTPATQPHSSVNPFISGVINLFSNRVIYLVSNQFGYSSTSASGERSILKQITLNNPFGELFVDNHCNLHDGVNVSKLVLNNLSFRLVNAHGWPVNLEGANWSFSLVFFQTRQTTVD